MKYGVWAALGVLLWLGSISRLAAQDTETRPLQISFYDNATQFPGADQFGVWGLPVHPGLTVGTEAYYRSSDRSQFFQTVRLGYHFQRFIQHSVLLYSEVGYRRYWGRFAVEGRLGGGYLHAISATPVFRQNGSGFERVARWGRPQAMAGLAVGPAYRIGGTAAAPLTLFLHYQLYLQFPFVGQYVPILPNTAVHLGISFPIQKRAE